MLLTVLTCRVRCCCSGGVLLSVQGRHLASVSEPKIVVYVNNRQFTNVSSTTEHLLACCYILCVVIYRHYYHNHYQIRRGRRALSFTS